MFYICYNKSPLSYREVLIFKNKSRLFFYLDATNLQHKTEDTVFNKKPGKGESVVVQSVTIKC